MKVEFKGGKDLEAALAQLGDKSAARRTAERALKLAAQPIRDAWAGGVDVEKGDLRRSIKIGKRAQTRATRKFRKGAGQDVVETFVGIDPSEAPEERLAVYAYFEEFGSIKREANPAGRNAWESEKMNALNRIAGDLWSEISKTAARAARKTARLSARSAKLDANADALRARLAGD
jgi:HK97 gp10 family phage protein